MLRGALPALLLLLALAFPRTGMAFDAGADLELGTGIEVLSDPRTTIEGLHRLYLGYPMGRGLHVGQAIYSAALGDAGGAFFWGFEGTKTWPLGRRLSAEAGLFLGGGGGAAQVVGDGLMTRAHLGLRFAASERLAIGLGGAWYRLSGADLDGPALALSLAYDLGAATPQAGAGPVPLRSFALRGSALSAPGSIRRDGSAQPVLGLVGAEASFYLRPGPSRTEVFFGGDGALQGGEGYMQILGGLRQRWRLGGTAGRASVFAEGSLGFGGGGRVDTGAGLLLGLGGGLALPLADGVDLELATGAMAAPDGAISGLGASLRLVRVFDRRQGGDPPSSQNWALTLGLSQQFPNATFRKSGSSATGKPVMQESTLDLFLTDRLYLTGNAQTTMGGDAAGYAIGMVGLGWRQPLAPRLALSVEAHLGAAGGGGVEASGGLIGGLRAELDYALGDRMSLNLGLGQIRALQGEGLAPVVLQIGLKLPFRAP